MSTNYFWFRKLVLYGTPKKKCGKRCHYCPSIVCFLQVLMVFLENCKRGLESRSMINRLMFYWLYIIGYADAMFDYVTTIRGRGGILVDEVLLLFLRSHLEYASATVILMTYNNNFYFLTIFKTGKITTDH